MSEPIHVLVVEDDREICSLVTRYLSENECRVSAAGTTAEMDRCLARGGVDLVLLDVMLPGEDGLSACRRLRMSSAVPIILLTARDEDIDRILGLEMGADDYVAKPFNPRELLARIRAVLRRGRLTVSGPEAEAEERTLAFNGWVLNPRLRELSDPERVRVPLTGAEFDLLHAFCQKPGRVLSRDQLLSLTQGRNAGPFERSVDVLVSRLRGKIERDARDPEMIKTIRSGGYVFTPEVERT